MDRDRILNKYILTEIDYKNPTKNYLEELYNFFLDQWREEYPKVPEPTFEKFKYDFTYSKNTDLIYKYCLRETNNNIIANSHFTVIKPDSDVPISKKEDVSFAFRIKESFRNNGIGGALLKNILNSIVHSHVKKIHTYSNLDSGQNFCKKYGGKVTANGFTSFLDIEKNNWEKTEAIFSDIKLKNPDIMIETHFKLKEEDIAEFVEFDSIFMEEISKYDVESTFDKEFNIKESTKYIREGLRKGQKHIYSYLRNKNNEIIGLTDLIIDPNSPLILFQDMTGIAKEYRGRGLAKFIKASTLLKLRDNHKPGSVISTYNDEENSIMRNINKSIGFKEVPMWKKYTFELKKLKERLEINENT